VYSFLSYGITVGGGGHNAEKYTMQLFTLQKKAVTCIAGLVVTPTQRACEHNNTNHMLPVYATKFICV
jgi:hypothetical protein